MNIEAFLLCDCATDQMGKLNVLGAFDSLYLREMPGFHPTCAVAARVRFTKIEAGDHQIRLNIIDADGKRVGPDLKGGIKVSFGEKADTTAVNIILNIQKLKFEKYGHHRIDLAIDGQLRNSLPLYVKKIPDQRPGDEEKQDNNSIN